MTDLASEEAAHKRKTREDEGYWAVFNSNGNRISRKFQNESDAKEIFTSIKGSGIFTWKEIESKGFQLRYIKLKEACEKDCSA